MNTSSISSRISATFFLFAMVFASFPAKSQYTINNLYGDLSQCDTMTRGIYLVWWDSDFDYSGQVDVLLDTMISYRNICLSELLMADPPNPEDGYYYNVYIHKPGDPADIFNPYGWGNGQGTDGNGYPFLTLPNGVLTDWVNNAHETFHIFQYNANSPGFSYSGNSQWYIEASANWFAARENPGAPRAFVEAESLVRVPHVPLWLSYGNYPSFYPSNWQRYVHQYALALLLYYLTDVAGIPENLITDGLFANTTEYPQEYMYNQIGATEFRGHFIDWAAHMTNGFDFIDPVQAETNENEWYSYADLWDDNEYTLTFEDEGSGGWYRPPDSLVTTSWSFNTYKLLNSNTETYTFEIDADPTGSRGDDAFFKGKVVVQNSITGASFHDLSMDSETSGSLVWSATPEDTAILFIVSSMPETFGDDDPGFQFFSYQMRIGVGTTSIIDIPLQQPAKEIMRFDILGREIDIQIGGIQFILYDNGIIEKIYLKGK